MLIVVLVLATLMTGFWLVLMSMAQRDDWIAAAYNKALDNLTAINKLLLKDTAKQAKLSEYHGALAVIMKTFGGGNSDKEIAKLRLQNERLQSGDFKSLGVLIIPGYVLLRKAGAIKRGSIHKTILTKSLELYGKKHAGNKTNHLLAKLLSYPIIGVALSLILGVVIMGLGSRTVGLAILGIGTLLVLVLVYAMYDEVSDQANKRREAIARQFPAMVSKLALLTTSGMIMERAWKETAYSQSLELYKEMQRTAEELDNLVSPQAAYGGFISRCNTKETAKLASAIMQNLSKGNAEIGILLKGIAKEAWLERRHTAKRDSEKANSKLMIPTMLLFLAILVMLMVPVVMNFQGL
ncbi:MAG: type II secretion system F family protein [Clostridiales bacterium]|jgi:tight adherence protein C|nr:type II secretion system F family protein [Clostridiales bacterium]